MAERSLTPSQRALIAVYLLTRRQHQILAHIARTGDTLAATGARLGISEPTVKNHLERAYIKLGVGGSTEAFITLGWLKVPAHRAWPERASRRRETGTKSRMVSSG